MAIGAEAYRDFEKQALTLPLEERSRLASLLLESLDEEDGLAISPEWENEIGNRIGALNNGTVKLVPHDEVMARFSAKFQAGGNA